MTYLLLRCEFMSKELSSGDRSSWDHKAHGSDKQGWQKNRIERTQRKHVLVLKT